MLRKDPTACFDKTGAWIFARYRFRSGALEAAHHLNDGAYRRLLRDQRGAPVQLMTDPARGRAWWMFDGQFYVDDEGLSAREVMAVALQRRDQQQRRVRRAVALMEGETASVALREPVAEELRAFVWQRDRGVCARCGSNERLEFDHIIPVARGGATTARNLQLLCESCNREKGAEIG